MTRRYTDEKNTQHREEAPAAAAGNRELQGKFEMQGDGTAVVTYQLEDKNTLKFFLNNKGIAMERQLGNDDKVNARASMDGAGTYADDAEQLWRKKNPRAGNAHTLGSHNVSRTVVARIANFFHSTKEVPEGALLKEIDAKIKDLSGQSQEAQYGTGTRVTREEAPAAISALHQAKINVLEAAGNYLKNPSDSNRQALADAKNDSKNKGWDAGFRSDTKALVEKVEAMETTKQAPPAPRQ